MTHSTGKEPISHLGFLVKGFFSQTPPAKRWLDELGRLKGGRLINASGRLIILVSPSLKFSVQRLH